MVLRPLLAIGIRRRRADRYLESLAYWEKDNFVWNNNLRANERDGPLSEPYSFTAFWIEVKGRNRMVRVGLMVRLEAKPGKESALSEFLMSGLALALKEPQTIVWFALRLGPSTFGIFDAFPGEPGREAHLTGPIAVALMEKAPDLLAQEPKIERVDVLAAKVPA